MNSKEFTMEIVNKSKQQMVGMVFRMGFEGGLRESNK